MTNMVVTFNELPKVSMWGGLRLTESLYQRYMREMRDEDRERPIREHLVPPWFGPVKCGPR